MIVWDVVAPLGTSLLIFLSLSIRPPTPMTLILSRYHHHSLVHLEHTNEEEKDEEITTKDKQNIGLVFRVQDHIPPNVAIPTSTLMIRTPPEDIEMEKSKKGGHVCTNIINERQPTFKDTHFEKTMFLTSCPLQLKNVR